MGEDRSADEFLWVRSRVALHVRFLFARRFRGEIRRRTFENLQMKLLRTGLEGVNETLGATNGNLIFFRCLENRFANRTYADNDAIISEVSDKWPGNLIVEFVARAWDLLEFYAEYFQTMLSSYLIK